MQASETKRKTPTKAEYKTLEFLESLQDDAQAAIERGELPWIGKYGNSKIRSQGSKAITLVYSGLAYHDCMPTAGCGACYAMRSRYLHAAAHRRGSSWLYSYMVRKHIGTLETMIRNEIASAIVRASLMGTRLAIRIHEAGDYISPAHVAMWHRITRAYPSVSFWGYTRSDRDSTMRDAIITLASAHNVHIRASMDPTPDGIEPSLSRHGLPAAIIVGRTHRGKKHGPARVQDAVNCPEQATNGAIGCADCGLCWHASRPVIRFWAH